VTIGAQYLGGKIIVHTPKIHVSAPPYSQAMVFSWLKQSTGNKAWQQRFGFPETGLNLALVHYGKKELGQAIGLYPSIQFRLLGNYRSHWFLKIGGGLGLTNQSWQRTPAADSINNILGSRLNNFTMIQSGYRVYLNRFWSAQAGLQFFHLSNAATRQPNYGINTLGFTAGVVYRSSGNMPRPVHHDWPMEKNRFNIGLKTAFSMAEAKAVDGPLYPYYHVSLFASQMYRNKSRAMLGLDATYSTELYALYKNNYRYAGHEREKAIRYSVFAAHEFVFGKIGLPLQFGYYLNRPAGGRKTYQKLGINWHMYRNDQAILKDVFLFTQLFTELVNAQYAEVGLGFMF